MFFSNDGMSDKRRLDDNDSEDDDEDDARDSLDLDAETEAQRRRDMARIQSAWNQRVGLMQQTMASLQDPTVMRAMQMILNLGLVTPTAEFMEILQLGMRDIEEKQRQEEERRRQRRFLGEEPVNYSPPSPPLPTYNEDGFAADIDAVVRRSQSSFLFGSSSQPRNNGDDDDVVDITEEKKQEQARLMSLYQPRNRNQSNAPPRPTILQRLEEKEQKASPLSQVNLPQEAVYQDAMNSISNRIRDFMARSRDGDIDDDQQYETESERNRRLMSRHNDFEWDEVVPPSPVPEDEGNDDNSSSEDNDDEEDSSDDDDEEGNDDE